MLYVENVRAATTARPADGRLAESSRGDASQRVLRGNALASGAFIVNAKAELAVAFTVLQGVANGGTGISVPTPKCVYVGA